MIQQVRDASFARPQVQIHDSVISPLYWAVRDGKLDMARLMIQARADTDQRAACVHRIVTVQEPPGGVTHAFLRFDAGTRE